MSNSKLQMWLSYKKTRVGGKVFLVHMKQRKVKLDEV